MARKFYFGDTLGNHATISSRLGAQSAPYKDTEIGKLVKGTTESGHVLCAQGDRISGQIVAVENATSDGYGMGSVQRNGRMRVIADGSQAAGTGSLVLGDQVVCGTVVAKDTALGTTYVKVAKATIQIGAVPADAAAAGVQLAFLKDGEVWTVCSLLGNSGAVGTEILIERKFALAD